MYRQYIDTYLCSYASFFHLLPLIHARFRPLAFPPQPITSICPSEFNISNTRKATIIEANQKTLNDTKTTKQQLKYFLNGQTTLMYIFLKKYVNG